MAKKKKAKMIVSMSMRATDPKTGEEMVGNWKPRKVTMKEWLPFAKAGEDLFGDADTGTLTDRKGKVLETHKKSKH